MAKSTPNLGLYQYEQSDGNQTFNIDTALNDNWEKIDGAVGDASGVAEELSTHKLDSTAHGIGDKTTLKTSEKTTIVGAVNELFTSASDGKTAIANAITGKNGTASSSDTFAQLALAISLISTGKKMAYDNFTISTSGGLYYKEVSINYSLDFVPSIFLAIDTSGSLALFLRNVSLGGYNFLSMNTTNTTQTNMNLDGNTYYVKQTGAKFRFSIYSNTQNGTATWFAFE